MADHVQFYMEFPPTDNAKQQTPSPVGACGPDPVGGWADWRPVLLCFLSSEPSSSLQTVTRDSLKSEGG